MQAGINGPVAGPASVWGRLASIQRTLAWACSSAEHASAARYLGMTCARLLDDVVSAEGLPEGWADGLGALRERFTLVDGLVVAERQAALVALSDALGRYVPLSQAGARVAVLTEGLSQLVTPADGPRGGQERAEGRPSGEGRPAPRTDARGEGRPESKAESKPESKAESKAEPRPERKQEPRSESRQDPRRDARPDPRPQARPPVEVAEDAPEVEPDRPAESQDAGRLPMGHPDGTGAALQTLGLSDDLLERLDAAGIATLADAFMCPPTGHVRLPLLHELPPPLEPVLVRGRVLATATRLAPGRRYWEATLAAHELRIVCRWQGEAPARVASWTRGTELAVVGVVGPLHDELLSLDEGEIVGLDGRGSGLMPEYGVDGVSDRELRDVVARSLLATMGQLRDPLPDDLIERSKLLPLDEALRDAHFPANAAARGRSRLAFEELLGLQVALGRRHAAAERGLSHKILHGNLGQVQVQFDITLDDDQETAFSDIRRDLRHQTPMTRLLMGDPGASKGLIAMLTAVIVAENRSQVAVVCSDASASERQFVFAEPMLRGVGIKALHVGDGVTHAQADAIRRGEAGVVFGSPRTITTELEWRRLGLVVLMERHSYGAVQLSHLEGKGPRPDLLVVASAPVPPSLLLTLYGGFELSLVRRTGGQKVAVRSFAAAERDDAYIAAREQIAAGRQVFVVFPTREGNDALSRDDAARVGEALRAHVLPGARVAVYSSQLSRDERARVLDDFVHRRADVLIATTLIEDGPPVKNATVVLVEMADRFDVSRLQRLKAHVGHGPVAGHCLLVRSQERNALSGLVDRFVDEPDRLSLAAPELDSVGSQGGAEPPPLSWAELPRDLDTLFETRALAFRLLREDAGLRRLSSFKRTVAERWPELSGEPDRAAPSAAEAARSGRKRRRRRRR